MTLNIDETNDHVRNLVNREMDGWMDDHDIDLVGPDTPVTQDQWNEIGESLFIDAGNLSCELCPGLRYDTSNDPALIAFVRNTLNSTFSLKP